MHLPTSARTRRPVSMSVPAAVSRAMLLSGGLLCLAGWAAAQNVKPPQAQLWMDVSTGIMAGMPEMDLPAGMGGMLGGFMGGRAGGGTTQYGQARGMNIMPPRVLDIALYNRLKPGIEATQFIPPGMRMGESLPLVPPPPAQPVRERESGDVPQEYAHEPPRGRILIYWGCSRDVRPGQPRVIDLARGNPADFSAAFAGRYVPERGVRVGPGYVLYPNERNRVNLGRDSSLVGEHQVRGDGVPASMKFSLGAAQDIMPAIELQSAGRTIDSMALTWRQVTNARAYYLHAMGRVGKDDMVMWSSAETPDTGMGLFDYLPHATVDRWLKDRVLLQPDTVHCDIPKGIFAVPGEQADGNREGAMLRMIAYGNESHFAYPPRPADPKAQWEPEWSVRVRVKSHAMAMLGQETTPSRGRRGGNQSPQPEEEADDGAQMTPAAPSRREPANPLTAPVNILKGLFGR